MPVITIGSDYSTVLKGVKNTVSGAALTGATVTFQLYTSAGVAVSGGDGTASYVSASAGTASDAEFAGVIESTVTTSLTAGLQYYVLYTVSSSGVDFTFREDVTAQSPGAVIIDAGLWSGLTGTSLTAGSADETSVEMLCAAVAEALTRLCYPILLAPKALTLYACDAPIENEFFTPVRPCRSISAIYLRPGADGDSSLATSDYLLTNYTDYVLDVDDALNGWSRTGRVYRRGSSCWGFELRRPLGRLAYATDPNRKAIFLSGSFGPASVSPVVRQAAATCVTLMYNSRTLGGQVQSNSWNGGSISMASAVTAEAAIHSPDVTALLRSAGVLPVHVG
jgi:hypothetical protein